MELSPNFDMHPERVVERNCFLYLLEYNLNRLLLKVFFYFLLLNMEGLFSF